MKYYKTKHEGIMKYETKKGTRYRVRITYDDHTKESSKSGFKTIGEAQAYKALMESKLLQEGSNFIEGERRTFGDQWISYRDYKIRQGLWNKNTIESSNYKIKPFLDEFNEVPLKEITAKKTQKVIDTLYRNKNYSQETVESYYRMFKQVIDDAVKEGYLNKNLTTKVSYKKDGWKPIKKTITLKEHQEFMTLAKKYMRQDIYRCLYLFICGLRRGEAYGVKESSIQFLDDGKAILTINTQRTRNYMEGKETKTASSNRIVIMDQVGAQYLKEQIEYAKIVKNNLNQILHKDDFIFINPNGKPYAEKTLNNAINAVAKKMKNPVRITPHMLRHMLVTQAIASGIDPLQLKSVVGHTKVSMTDHYTDVSIESAEAVMLATENIRNIDKSK